VKQTPPASKEKTKIPKITNHACIFYMAPAII